MVEIEMLPAAAAGDAELVTELTRLVNHAYEAAEHGLWRGGVERTTVAETAAAVAHGQVVVAREDGCLVGAVRVRRLDDETSWLGALAVDEAYGGRGIGRLLVEHAERVACEQGASAVRLELLVPDAPHPHAQGLAGWYRRLGYRAAGHLELAEVHPGAELDAVSPCHVEAMLNPPPALREGEGGV